MHGTSGTYRARTTADSRTRRGCSTCMLSSYDMIRHLTMFLYKNDMISWLIDVSDDEHRNLRSICLRILVLNFAALHTSAQVWRYAPEQIDYWHLTCLTKSLTHALLNLATYPQYCTPLREEASAVIDQDGWSKTAMTKLVKMDSFLKESQRFNSTTLCRLLFIFGDTKLISGSPYDAQSNAAIRILGWYCDTQRNSRRCRFITYASRRGILRKRVWVSTFPVFTTARGHWRRPTKPASFHKCKLYSFWVRTSCLVR